MKYYGIVNKFKDEHKSGIYARRQITSKELNRISSKYKLDEWLELIFLLNPSVLLTNLIFQRHRTVEILKSSYENISNIFKKKEKSRKLEYKAKINLDSARCLCFFDETLDGDYNIIDESLNYGLFDKIGNSGFEKMMKSEGGSSMFLLEKNSIPNQIIHFSGNNVNLSYGLYCEHPRKDNVLLPLENLPQLLQSLLLEETIRIYEVLGAKEIVIEDMTDYKSSVKGKDHKYSIKIESDSKINTLRTKTYGDGVFDIERAEKYHNLVYDYPAIMSVVEARKYGNQTLEDFIEDVDLSAGIDVGVLGLFNLEANLSLKRRWRFKVEFWPRKL